MKKIIVFTVALVAAVMSQAANLDWKYSTTVEEVGATVYALLGTTAITEWESEAVLKASAADFATVGKNGRQYAAAGMIVSDDISKTSANVYYVVVADGGKSFGVTSVADMSASVYDPNSEGSAGSDLSLNSTSITKSGLAWGSGSDPIVPTPTPIDPSGVPEPTSGLLLLVGGAALALRRKQK